MCKVYKSYTVSAYWNSLDSVITLDSSTKHAFVADYSGVITVLKLDPNNFQEITTLRGHQSKQL